MHRYEITVQKYSLRILTWLKDSLELKKEVNFSQKIRPTPYFTLNINNFRVLLSLHNLYCYKKIITGRPTIAYISNPMSLILIVSV